MSTLAADLAGARAATTALLTDLERLDGDLAALRAPSLLPGWTRAHVVAHLAGNARSHVRLLDGCLAGEVRRQYAGGADERAAHIEELAARPQDVVEEHRSAGRRTPGSRGRSTTSCSGPSGAATAAG